MEPLLGQAEATQLLDMNLNRIDFLLYLAEY